MNKNLFKLAFVLLSFGVFFSSCSDEETLSNAFSYKGQEYPIEKGRMITYGSVTTGVYNIDLELYSSEVNPVSDTGTGNMIYFEMFTNNNTSLAAGEYTFTQTEANYTFDIAKFYINFNFGSWSGTSFYVHEGTVNIKKSGTTFTIDIDCTDDQGNVIKGNYEGTLSFTDASKSKK